MVPTLLIHDHILVSKLAFGVKIPFANKFLLQWGQPKRGEIVVFKSPENPDIFFVKRLVGLGGDEVELSEGTLKINGNPWNLESIKSTTSQDINNEQFSVFRENSHHVVRYRNQSEAQFSKYSVPENHYFMMGDNRDESSDSRVWGAVPNDLLVGRVTRIWFSCDEMLESAPFLCNLQTMRWSRILQGVQ